jgi:hypothetical protein
MGTKVGERRKKWIFTNGKTKNDISICALGGSVATPKTGIKATVIEVKSLENWR